MNEIVELLSSIQVAWEGTEVGLMPVVVDGNSEAIVKRKAAAIPALIDALSHEGLFVISHVLLTQISRVEYETFPTWNGLAVELAADGSVMIDPAQRFSLAKRWEQWYQTVPHPSVLPPDN